MAFAEVGIHLRFEGNEAEEKGIVESLDAAKMAELELNNNLQVGDVLVAVDPRYYRPTEVDLLIGDPSKSNQKLGWKPKYNVQSLVKDMMSSDIRLMKKDKFLKDSGHDIMRYFE